MKLIRADVKFPPGPPGLVCIDHTVTCKYEAASNMAIKTAKKVYKLKNGETFELVVVVQKELA